MPDPQLHNEDKIATLVRRFHARVRVTRLAHRVAENLRCGCPLAGPATGTRAGLRELRP